MISSEEPPSENTVCIPVEEYDRLIFLGKINKIVSTMSLQQLKQAVKIIEILVLEHD